MNRRWLGSLVVGSLMLAACGAPQDGGEVSELAGTETTDSGVETESSTTASSTTAVDPSTSAAAPTTAEVPLRALDRCDAVVPVTTNVVGDGQLRAPDQVFGAVLRGYASEHPDTFAGMWIDREAYGTQVLAFTDAAPPHREALAARQPTAADIESVSPPPEVVDDRPIGEWGIPFDVVQVAHNEQQLLTAQGAVFNRAAEVFGTTAVGVGLNTMRNRVVIGGPPITPETLDELAHAIDEVGGVDASMVCWDGQFVSEAPPPINPETPLDIIAAPDANGAYAPTTAVTCNGIDLEWRDFDELVPIASADPGLQAIVDSWSATIVGAPARDQEWFVLANDGEAATMVAFDE